MTSRKQRAQQLIEVQRGVRIYNFLFLIVGAAAVAAAVAIADEDLLETVLALTGGALVSAALISFVFGSVTIRETTLQVDHAVMKGMEEVLEPVREALFLDAWSSYRWDCYLDLPENATPAGYADQLIRISYRDPDLPTEVRLVCAASNEDDALEPYLDDERYIFRWLVEPDLDPTDPGVFDVGYLHVEGQALEPVDRLVSEGSVPTAEYRFPVPRDLRELGRPLIDFSVLVRKFALDQHLRVQTHLFRTVTDAEYRLTLGPGLPATAIDVKPSVVALGATREKLSGATFSGNYGNRSAHAIFSHAIQRGSNVAFVIDRARSDARG